MFRYYLKTPVAVKWCALMEANKKREKWTTFHTEAAHRLFANDMEKIKSLRAHEFDPEMKKRRQLLEGIIAQILI